MSDRGGAGCTREGRRPRRWLAPVVVASAAILLAALPYLAAFRAQDSETRFVGLVGGVDDNNVYLDLMRQAAEGEWLFVNNFTPEPCRPVLFNLLYQALGRLCGLTGLPLISAHHLFGLASIFLFAFLANGFFGSAFRDGRFRAAGVALAVFASGLFGLGELLGGAIGWQSRSVDSWLAELTTFHSVLIYPHFVFSAALVVGSLHLFLSGIETRRWARALGGGLVCSVLVFSHAFDAATVLGTIAVFSAATLWLEGSPGLRRAIPALAAFVTPVLLSLAATRLMMRQEPLWASVVGRLDFPTPDPWKVLLGTGVTGALALFFIGIGAAGRTRIAAARPRRNGVVFLSRCWLLAAALLCYLPWIPWQWHLLNGIQVPLSLIALDGIRRGAFVGRRRYGRLARAWGRTGALSKAASPACVGLALLCCLAALSDPYLVRKYTIAARDHARDLFLSRGEQQAMSWLEHNAAREDVVLASPEISHFIPRFSGNKVVAGEDLLTKNYADKKEGTDRFYGRWGDADRLAFLSSWRVRYVMHGPAERRLGSWSPASLARLEEVFRSGESSIYRVREASR